MSRIIFIFFLLNLLSSVTYSQLINYNTIDSLSRWQYLRGEWDELLHTTKLAEENEIIYPNLMLRSGYAALMKENHSLSLKYYGEALKMNSYNTTALYYAAYNNLQLSRPDAALFLTKNLSDESISLLNLHTKKTIESADGELSIKPTNSALRNAGNYFRLRISQRINYRWKMSYCMATYRQNFLAPLPPPRGPLINPSPTLRTFPVGDFQLYANSVFYINANLSLTNAIHYSSTTFDNNKFKTAILHTGIKYLFPLADFKMEINTGLLLDSMVTQVALSSTYFPLGNLRFYGNSRFSFQKSANLSQVNFYQMLGFKLQKKIWIEFNCILGQINNLIDNEALYIYDAYDPSQFRIGSSLIIPFTNHFNLNANYFYELKKIQEQNINYNLNSFTLGFTWKI